MDEDLISYLYQFISDNKNRKIKDALDHRTFHLTVVLENIFQSQNASAVLRSCEVLGIQKVNVVEQNNTFNLNPKVVMGAAKWLDIDRFDNTQNNTRDCIESLKEQGYTVVATSPHAHQDIHEINLERPLALMFGTELTGLSDQALELADEKVKIPMYGFTESYNISVSAAMTMFTLVHRMKEEVAHWKMNEEQQLALKYRWARKILKNAQLIEDEYNHRKQKKTL